MTGFGKRADDNGHENPIVTLARIDENIKSMKSSIAEVKETQIEHEKDDEKKFNGIYEKLWEHAKYIYMGLGIVAILEILTRFSK